MKLKDLNQNFYFFYFKLLDDEDEDIQPATENGDVDEGGSSDQAEKTDGKLYILVSIRIVDFCLLKLFLRK